MDTSTRHPLFRILQLQFLEAAWLKRSPYEEALALANTQDKDLEVRQAWQKLWPAERYLLQKTMIPLPRQGEDLDSYWAPKDEEHAEHYIKTWLMLGRCDEHYQELDRALDAYWHHDTFTELWDDDLSCREPEHLADELVDLAFELLYRRLLRLVESGD